LGQFAPHRAAGPSAGFAPHHELRGSRRKEAPSEIPESKADSEKAAEAAGEAERDLATGRKCEERERQTTRLDAGGARESQRGDEEQCPEKNPN